MTETSEKFGKNREFGWYNIPEKLRPIYDILSTIQLLERLDKATLNEKIVNNDDYTYIPWELANRLRIALTEDIAEHICNLWEDFDERLSELEQNFKAHRHDTSKQYSEKPAW